MREKSKKCPKIDELSSILDSSLPSLYQSGSKWYFKIWKGDKRISVSTGEEDKKRGKNGKKDIFFRKKKRLLHED